MPCSTGWTLWSIMHLCNRLNMTAGCNKNRRIFQLAPWASWYHCTLVWKAFPSGPKMVLAHLASDGQNPLAWQEKPQVKGYQKGHSFHATTLHEAKNLKSWPYRCDLRVQKWSLLLWQLSYSYKARQKQLDHRMDGISINHVNDNFLIK